MVLSIGTKLGHYEILSLVGSYQRNTPRGTASAEDSGVPERALRHSQLPRAERQNQDFHLKPHCTPMVTALLGRLR